MREYNASVPPERRLRFDGFDAPTEMMGTDSPRQLLTFAVDYLGWLAENREWLAGPNLSLADFAAAAHLSCLDYIGDVDWRLSRTAKDSRQM